MSNLDPKKVWSYNERVWACARVAELEGKIDQLIEIGGWAITGMTIATSYSPGKMQNLAEKKSDDWYALIKNLKECDKEKEREE